jgi:hypothetical protein
MLALEDMRVQSADPFLAFLGYPKQLNGILNKAMHDVPEKLRVPTP